MFRARRAPVLAIRSLASKRCLSGSSSKYENIRVLEDDGEGFAELTLTRPKVHNAISQATVVEIRDALNSLSNAKRNSPLKVRGLFIRAEGKSFSAGGDLNDMKNLAEASEQENINAAVEFSRFLNDVATFPAPTMALIQGAALGGGVGLVSVCDIAVAVKSSVFALSEVKLGLIPAMISPYVVRRIGANQARRYFLTAERFDAETAEKIGLVHQVTDDLSGLEVWKTSLKDSLKGNAPSAVSAAKNLIDFVSSKTTIDDSLIVGTAHLLAKQRGSNEGREGVRSFLEKQKPSWISTA